MNFLKKNFNKFMTILMYIPALLTSKAINYDFYFLYLHGKTILENGFVTKEPFSMHENMDFLIQQWMVSILYYKVYDWFGKYGLGLLIILIEMSTIFMLYKTLKLICNNDLLAKILTFPSSLIMLQFATQRPFMVTYLITICLFYFIIKYTKTNNCKYLIALPIISLLQINIQCSMWIFLFIMMCPFFAETKLFATGNLYCENYRKLPLMITSFIMIIMGFINPYGYKSIIYVFNSISKNDIGIAEMQSPKLTNFSGICILIIFTITFLLILNIKNKINIRYGFLFLGSLILTFFAMRNLPYLGLATSLLYADLLKDVDIKKILEKIFGIYELYVPILAIGLLLFSIFNFIKPCDDDITRVSDVVQYLQNNYETKGKTVYAGYDEGAYFNYCGFKSYIDVRMEVHLEKQNHQFDYVEEFYNLQYKGLDYKEFLSKYNFDFIVVNKNDILYDKITNEDNYELVYENDFYKSFVKIQ